MSANTEQTFEHLVADRDDAGVFVDARLRRSFMLLLVEQLPLNSLETSWLATARHFAKGAVTETELERARVEAWNSLGGR